MAGTGDPLAVLRLAAHHAPELIAELDDALTEAEVRAAATARPTPGAVEFLTQCRDQGKPVVIVSNNSRAGVAAYLEGHNLGALVAEVIGRPLHRPDPMKPEPWMVLEAQKLLRITSGTAVLIGDSVSDMQVAHKTNHPAVGLASREPKRETLALAGANVVVDTMLTLLSAPG